MIGATVRLNVHLRELAAILQHRFSNTGNRVHSYAGDDVGPRAEKQVAALAAHVGHGQDSVERQFLLNGKGVRKYFLGNRIAGRVHPGLETFEIVDIEAVDDGLAVYRENEIRGWRDGDAVTVDRLDLVFGLAGA